MALRCLLFSSHEEIARQIGQVLTDLGIEGEYCGSAVDAVERVTTQMFQIVITDWDNQPEAAFLLKTARDLKASQRPLTLAIVGQDAGPEALKAGANSVLLKPIRAEQVRDTMSTACELLRAKQQPPAPQQPVAQQTITCAPGEAPPTATLAAAASAGTVSVPMSVPPSAPLFVPPSISKAPEKTFRAGEFLQSPSSAPGAQFDTEDTESGADTSLEQAGAEDVDVLTELEPTAAGVKDAPMKPAEPPQPLTGWTALQAHLTRAAPAAAEDLPAQSELRSYGETPSYGTKVAPAEGDKDSAKKQPQLESRSAAALFAYMPGEQTESSELLAKPHSRRGRLFVAGILVAVCITLVALPRARRGLQTALRSAVRAGGTWLNPPPAPVPQAAPQHDSFGQSGDEYKLPAVENIPDATTDPSQVRVLPVVDPTAKPEKGSEANGGQTQVVPGDNNHTEQNPAASSQGGSGQSGSSQAGSSQSEPGESGPTQGAITGNDPTTSAGVPGYAAGTAPVSVRPAVQPNAPTQAVVPPRPSAPPTQKPPHAPSAGSSAGIPSSLKSQIASMTPASGGNKPPEAAMSSIEPVNLPESAARDLLTESVDPQYPAAAKAGGQRGSVVLQALIGRDGTVQDAKFLSGSLVFARAAIDAVKQWRFKPYSMNGRAVSVQTVITLKFQPAA